MVHIKIVIERLPENVCSEIFEELENYCKILKAKYGIRYTFRMGPFYSTVEKEVEA